MNLNIFVHMIILFAFLTAFYFLFVTKLTSDVFNSEIKHLIETNVANQMDKLTLEQRNHMSFVMSNINLDKLSTRYATPDTFVEEHNWWVQHSAISIVIISVVVLLVIMYILSNSCGQCIPIWEFFRENIIVFALVGYAEYLFFTNVAFKYVPSPPSLLVSTLIEKFKTSLVERSQL